MALQEKLRDAQQELAVRNQEMEVAKARSNEVREQKMSLQQHKVRTNLVKRHVQLTKLHFRRGFSPLKGICTFVLASLTVHSNPWEFGCIHVGQTTWK